ARGKLGGLQRVVGVERYVCRFALRVPGLAAKREAEGVVDELTPRPAPLGDLVLREDVGGEQAAQLVVGALVGEHPVGDVAAVRPGRHRAQAVGVPRGQDPRVRGPGGAPGGMRLVVSRPVEAWYLEGG